MALFRDEIQNCFEDQAWNFGRGPGADGVSAIGPADEVNVDRLPVENRRSSFGMSPRFNLGAESVRRRLQRPEIGECCVSAAQPFAVHHYYTGPFAKWGFKMHAVNAVSKHQLAAIGCLQRDHSPFGVGGKVIHNFRRLGNGPSETPIKRRDRF
jgi:hypothetical protein